MGVCAVQMMTAIATVATTYKTHREPRVFVCLTSKTTDAGKDKNEITWFYI